MINLSQYESMSLIVLEAMALGTPVIINPRCGVFQRYLEDCPLAFAAVDGESFHKAKRSIAKLLENPSSYEAACNTTQQYLQENFSWQVLDGIVRHYFVPNGSEDSSKSI